MDKNDPYEVDPKLVSEFSPEKFNEYLKVFKAIDVNNDGKICRGELIKGNLVS